MRIRERKKLRKKDLPLHWGGFLRVTSLGPFPTLEMLLPILNTSRSLFQGSTYKAGEQKKYRERNKQ